MKPRCAPPGSPHGLRPSQRPFLHRVLRGEFPGFPGTTALCDSLYLSRRTRLPSPDDTLRCACRFAPGGPGRPTAGLGFVSRSPPPAKSAGRHAGSPRFPGSPVVPSPCSPTPAGPDTPGHYSVPAWPPLCPQRRLPRQSTFRGSIARLWDWLFTLRPVRCHTGRKTRFRSLAKLSRAGLVTRRAAMNGFGASSTSSFPELSWRKDILDFRSFNSALGFLRAN
jgi:hypothetical protein